MCIYIYIYIHIHIHTCIEREVMLSVSYYILYLKVEPCARTCAAYK